MILGLVGGGKLSSALSSILLIPAANPPTVQAFTPLTIASGMYTVPSGGFVFRLIDNNIVVDSVEDNGTDTGSYWAEAHTMVARVLRGGGRGEWYGNNPIPFLDTMAQNMTGFQIYATIGTQTNTMGGVTGQYYWSPSMKMRRFVPKIQMQPIKLVQFEFELVPNSPVFFYPGSAAGDALASTGAIATYLAYLTAIGEGF